jgi:hypothetical protein
MHSRDSHPPHLIMYLPAIRPTACKAARLAVEGMVVPWLLVALLLPHKGLIAALASAMSWSALVLLVRWGGRGRLPGTLMLTGGLLVLRCAVSLAAGSAFVYLLQPVLGSCVMAMLFMGSSLLGRPVTMRLAQDFVEMPAHLLERPQVRRMFRDVGLVWGVSRLLDAAISYGFLHLGIDYALYAKALVSPVLLVASIGTCFWLGRRALARDGIRLSRGPAAA